MNRTSIKTWIADASANGIGCFYSSDFAIVQASRNVVRHNRLGAIPRDMSKEGAGTKVYAFGFDELGNCVALCADGKTRQFVK